MVICMYVGRRRFVVPDRKRRRQQRVFGGKVASRSVALISSAVLMRGCGTGAFNSCAPYQTDQARFPCGFPFVLASTTMYCCTAVHYRFAQKKKKKMVPRQRLVQSGAARNCGSGSSNQKPAITVDPPQILSVLRTTAAVVARQS